MNEILRYAQGELMHFDDTLRLAVDHDDFAFCRSEYMSQGECQKRSRANSCPDLDDLF